MRGKYTGAMFAFHLLFLVAFLMPYVGRTMFWVGLGRLEEAAQLRFVRNEGDGEQAAPIDELHSLLRGNLKQRQVWELVLGLDKGYGYFALVLVLLTYNAGRGVLTYCVGPLRDQEARTDIFPAWSEYRWLYVVHRAVVAPLFFISVVSLLWHAGHWMCQPVWVVG